MKRLVAVTVCILFLLSFCSCQNTDIHKCVPAKQPNTYWVSENGDISFYVHSFSRVLGKMVVADEEIEVQFWWGFMGLSNLEIYSLDYLNDTAEPYEHESEYYLLEKWTCDFFDVDTFIATVEETTYFEKGERLVFNKSDVADNEIIYPPDDAITENSDNKKDLYMYPEKNDG